jgi:hypothetical protein
LRKVLASYRNRSESFDSYRSELIEIIIAFTSYCFGNIVTTLWEPEAITSSTVMFRHNVAKLWLVLQISESEKVNSLLQGALLSAGSVEEFPWGLTRLDVPKKAENESGVYFFLMV